MRAGPALLLAALAALAAPATGGGEHRTIWLEPGDEHLGVTLRMRSDAFSLVGGVRALVVHEDEGEMRVTYRNRLADHTIVHIHGINPQENGDGQDGFPLVRSWTIAPGESKHVQYALRQTGTYFLHSHLFMQQHHGLVMPLIIRERAPPPGFGIGAAELQRAHDALVLLEERCPYREADPKPALCASDQAEQVLQGMRHHWAKVESSLEETFQGCSDAGDGLDVQFLHHLVNGQQHYNLTIDPPQRPPQDTPASELVRVRILNGASMTSYKVFLPSNSTIIKADGSWVVPQSLPHVWVGVGQRYEVLVRATSAFMLSAAAESFTHVPLPHERASLRVAFNTPVPDTAPGGRRSRGSSGSGSSSSGSTDVLDQLLAATGTADDSIDGVLEQFPPEAVSFADAENYTYRITGHHGYMSLNGSGVIFPEPAAMRAGGGDYGVRCVGQPAEMVVRYGGKYCLTLINADADAHVFHLHGHEMTTVETSSAHARRSQLAAWRDSVVVPGGNCARRTVCFVADNAAGGYWPMHCHMSYHLAAGMLLFLRYEEQSEARGARRELPEADGLCARLARLSRAHELAQEKVRDWSVPLVVLALVGAGAACVAVGCVVRRRRKQARYYNMSLSAALGSAPVTHSSGEREREESERERERGRERERERESYGNAIASSEISLSAVVAVEGVEGNPFYPFYSKPLWSCAATYIRALLAPIKALLVPIRDRLTPIRALWTHLGLF